MNGHERPGFLVSFAIERPIAVSMAVLALLVLGSIAYWKIPVELFPRGFNHPSLTVIIPYRNSDPAIVEQQITKPVEEYLSTVRKLREIRSRSRTDGARLRLQFDSDTNMKLAYSQVQDRIDRARTDFPEDVGQEFIWKFDLDDAPIMWWGITIDRELEDPYHLIETGIRSALVRVEGVARVDIHGMQEKTIQIDIDREAVSQHRLDLYQLIQFLRKNNFSLPAGDMREGGQRYFVRAVGHFKSLGEIENLKVGEFLRLKDIARVNYTFERKDYVTRLNRKTAFFCAVYKESNANTVNTCKSVEKFLYRELAVNPNLQNFSCVLLWDQGEEIENSLRNLKESLLWGAFLAVLVLILFLRSLRMTLFITLSIPLSLWIALVVMYFSNDSLNILSLTGLTLGVGMLVDNAVVVVENIDRRRQLGESARSSALWGASEVGLAVTLSTATTLVVFLPLILMNEDVQFKFFMTRLGLPVCFSLVGSLIVALILVPLVSTHFPKWNRNRPRGTGMLIHAYSRLLQWTLARRFDAGIVFMLILCSTYFPYSQLAMTDAAGEEERVLVIELILSGRNELAKTEEVFGRVEQVVDEHARDLEIAHILSMFRENRGVIQLFLTPPEEARLSAREITAELKRLLPQIPGVRYKLNRDTDTAVSQKIDIVLEGPDTATLYQIAGELEQSLSLIPELEGIAVSAEEAEDEIRLMLHRELTFAMGLSPSVVIATVAYALRGSELPYFKATDREIPMLARYQNETVSREELENMPVLSPIGMEIPLSAFSAVEVTKGPREIIRENHKTSLKVEATSSGNLNELRPKLLSVLSGLALPQGYSLRLGARFKQMEENNKSLLFAFFMSITFVFFLMGILFESWMLPFSILASIPFAAFGVMWMLYLTKTPFEVMSGIGLVILAGIVVNNAIVLVDCITRVRNQGTERSHAIVTAGEQRLRPILITALTTVVGLIPMAIGKSHIGGVPYYPLAVTVIGGLVASTAFTLLAVPLFYTFCDDLRQKFHHLAGSMFFRKGPDLK